MHCCDSCAVTEFVRANTHTTIIVIIGRIKYYEVQSAYICGSLDSSPLSAFYLSFILRVFHLFVREFPKYEVQQETMPTINFVVLCTLYFLVASCVRSSINTTGYEFVVAAAAKSRVKWLTAATARGMLLDTG